MSEKLVNPLELQPGHFHILALSAVRALVRKGVLQKEDITVEMMQLGVSADWAFLLHKLIEQMPGAESSD